MDNTFREVIGAAGQAPPGWQMPLMTSASGGRDSQDKAGCGPAAAPSRGNTGGGQIFGNVTPGQLRRA